MSKHTPLKEKAKQFIDCENDKRIIYFQKEDVESAVAGLKKEDWSVCHIPKPCTKCGFKGIIHNKEGYCTDCSIDKWLGTEKQK